MKKILVTGTKGFIGKNFLREVKTKFVVVEINEDIFDSKNWQQNLIEILQKNQIEAVFHIGAVSNTLEKDVNYIMIRNCEFTDLLGKFCFSKNIPIIYSSSAANYGIDGKTPSNLYGWSKFIGEKMILNYGGVALRYYNVYGPGEENKGNMASVLYQMWIKNKNGEDIKIFPGNPKRDFVYVDDIVSANIFAYENYFNIEKKFYDVGTGDANTFEYVLDLIDIKYNYHLITDVPDGYQMYTKADSAKFIPGWKPKYKLKEGVETYKKYLSLKSLNE